MATTVASAVGVAGEAEQEVDVGRSRRARRAGGARAGGGAGGGGRRPGAGGPAGRRRARSAARARRSPSSYHCRASRRATSAATRAGSLPRAVRARAVSDAGPGDAQLAVQVAQGDDGRRVVVDAGVEARRVVDDPLDGEVDDGRRHRVAALGVQRRRAEQLGDAVQREHVDGRRAAAPAERPAGHHAGGVRRHDHRHRGERVATLGRPHGGRQRIERRRPVGGGGDGDGHVSIVRKGCHPARAAPDQGAGRRRRRWRGGGARVTACSRPSGSRYRALPATRTLAPAAAARPTVSGPMPPSTSTSIALGQPGGLDHPPDLGDLGLHRGEVALAAEPRVDGHHEHEVDEVEHVGDGARRGRRADRHAGARPRARRWRRACGAGAGRPRRGRSAAGTRPRRSAAAITSGVSTIRWASNGTLTYGRAEAMTSGPNVRLGTNWPSMTSHWMRSTPAFSSAVTSSPRRAKSAGSTDGAIWIGRAIGVDGTA